MKKIIIALCLLLATMNLFAFSYSPDLSIATGVNFTRYSKAVDSYDKARATFAFSTSSSLIAFTTSEDVRLSFPLGIEYMTQSSVKEMTRLMERVRVTLGVRADVLFTDMFGIYISPAIGYTAFPDINNASSLCMELTTGLNFIICDYLSMAVPVKFVAGKEEAEIDVSLSFSVYPFGIKDNKK